MICCMTYKVTVQARQLQFWVEPTLHCSHDLLCMLCMLVQHTISSESALCILAWWHYVSYICNVHKPQPQLNSFFLCVILPAASSSTSQSVLIQPD